MRGSTIDKALRFWERRLETENKEREARASLDVWSGTGAQSRLDLDRALLRLWREPGDAAKRLWMLRGRFGPEIRSSAVMLGPLASGNRAQYTEERKGA